MSDLRRSLDEYLTVRRALGFKLTDVDRLLATFVAFADRAGARTVTVDLAVAWATLPTNGKPIWLAHRLSMVRGFARYLSTIDPATEIPSADLLPHSHYRAPTPYLYSDEDIAALMAVARRIAPPLRSATFEALIGLLAATGLRLGEAMRLDRDDVDWVNGLLTVRGSKFGRSRETLCHPSTVEALRAYSVRRDQLCPRPASRSFFVSVRGGRLVYHSVYPTFHRLLRQADVQRQSPRQPRVHDFRHSFAVKTLLRWYRDGDDVQTRMPLLSTYLGHVNPANTYWYLSAAPELMALAARRLESAEGERA
jgi:integrase/recombinase XerD